MVKRWPVEGTGSAGENTKLRPVTATGIALIDRFLNLEMHDLVRTPMDANQVTDADEEVWVPSGRMDSVNLTVPIALRFSCLILG